MEDLKIKNGVVVTPSGTILGGLTVSNEKITQVGSDARLPTAKTEIDAEGNWIIPGHIDPHLHLGQDKEEKFRDQFRSDSISAAIGGITTGMTTCRFGKTQDYRIPDYQKAKKIGCETSFIDFKLWAFMTSEKHLDEIPGMMKEGLNCYKLMMGYTREEARQIGLEGVDWGYAFRLCEIAGKIGPPALVHVHCEEPEIIHVLRKRLKDRGRNDLAAWTESRPSICEAMHIFDAGLIAKHCGNRLYIVHMSSLDGVDALRYLKAQGVKIFGETCPHYLVLDRHAESGILAKVNPPLRDRADQEKLWAALADGTLDTIGSDHVPWTSEEKCLGEDAGIWKGKPGFGSMGATLAILLSEGVNKGRITMEQLVKVTAENTARVLGIYPRKGVLAPGSDADIVIVDPQKEWVFTAGALQSRTDYTIYEGMTVKGKAVKTFVRGRLIAADGALVADTPSGRYVPFL